MRLSQTAYAVNTKLIFFALKALLLFTVTWQGLRVMLPLLSGRVGSRSAKEYCNTLVLISVPGLSNACALMLLTAASRVLNAYALLLVQHKVKESKEEPVCKLLGSV